MGSAKRKPRVLMIGPGRQVRGGISTVVNSYFEFGLDEKNELTYLSTMEDGNKSKKLLIAIMSYIRFCKKIKQYDILHVHMAAQASFARKALFIRTAYKRGKKIIIHQHAADFDKYYFEQSDVKKQKKIKEVFGLADRIIVLSDEWADFFGKNICDESKIEIMYNGVSIPEYEKKEYVDNNVLFLGRLGERKGTYDLLKVIPEVLKSVPDAMFYLCGDGDIERCNEIVEKEKLQKNVKILGWISGEERVKYLGKCSTFILPSHHEGMPMSVLEAMSYGLATISSNAGGIPQIIENGVNGLRIDAGNLKDISDSLVKILSDKRFKESIGRAGRARIMNYFNVEGNIERLNHLYSELEEFK